MSVFPAVYDTFDAPTPANFEDDPGVEIDLLIKQLQQAVLALETSIGDIASRGVVNPMLPEFGAVGNNIADDTVAVQAAIDATDGRALFLPAGKTFLVTTLLPVPGLVIFGYGATITQQPLAVNTTGSAVIDGSPTLDTTVRSGFACYGVTFLGAGTETENRQSAVWLNGWNDCTVLDCTAKNFTSGAFQFRNGKRIKVTQNTIDRCCTGAQIRNAINFGDAPNGPTTNYVQDLTATNNLVSNCPAPGVAIGLGYNDNSSVGGKVRAAITGNIITGSSGYAAIDLELGASGGVQPQMREIAITGNVCDVNATAGGNGCAISVTNPGLSDDVTIYSDIAISANQITSTNAGIRAEGSDVTITGNDITCNNLAVEVTSAGPARNHLQRVNIGGNKIRTTINPATGLGLISVQYVDDLTVASVKHAGDPGGSASTVAALYVDNCDGIEIAGYRSRRTPAYGIRFGPNVSNITLGDYRVYDCNEGGGAATGRAVYFSGGAPGGKINTVARGTIVDTRNVSQLAYGVYVATASPTLHLLDNSIFGATGAPVAGTVGEQVGTRTDANPTAQVAAATISTGSWTSPHIYQNLDGYPETLLVQPGATKIEVSVDSAVWYDTFATSGPIAVPSAAYVRFTGIPPTVARFPR